MRAVILAPGPSLANLTAVPVADVVIGVNRAATRFPVGYWSAMDYCMIRDFRAKVLGNPGLLTHVTTWGDVRGKVAAFRKVILLEDIAAACPVKFAWRSTPAAILLASHLGATQIDIYGDDRTQQPDFDGHKTAETMTARNPERWASEAKDCDAIGEWLAGRGVEVNRVNAL